VDAGNAITASLTLSPGIVYYAVVRAYNARYEAGPASEQITINLGAQVAPTARITASLAGNSAVVTWETANAVSATINGAPVGTAGSATVVVSGPMQFTLIATGAAGATARATATVTPVAAAGAPTAPINLTGSATATGASLTWQAPAGGGAPHHYLVYAGTTAGGTDVANGLSLGRVLSVSSELPRGGYYIRVRAVNAAGTSPESNAIFLRVGRRLASPRSFNVDWSGTTAVLTWTAAIADTVQDVPSTYVLEAGTAPGQSDAASVSVGNTTSFSANVAYGTYYVRVRAVNDHGESEPTADLVLVAPGAPLAPSGLVASGAGSIVDLVWAAPAGGAAPTTYVVEAGSAPGLSNLGIIALGDVLRFSAVVPAGSYHVRVRAANAQGRGESSNEIVVRR
jgi:titin